VIVIRNKRKQSSKVNGEAWVESYTHAVADTVTQTHSFNSFTLLLPFFFSFLRYLSLTHSPSSQFSITLINNNNNYYYRYFLLHFNFYLSISLHASIRSFTLSSYNDPFFIDLFWFFLKIWILLRVCDVFLCWIGFEFWWNYQWIEDAKVLQVVLRREEFCGICISHGEVASFMVLSWISNLILIIVCAVCILMICKVIYGL